MARDLATAYMWLYLAYKHAQNYGAMQETMTAAAHTLKKRLTNAEVARAEARASLWLTGGMPEPSPGELPLAD